MRPVFHEKINDWIIPILLAATVASLAGIYKELNSISQSLAVAISKIQDHDRRIENLEYFFYPKKK